jgi:spore coat protein A
VFPYLKVEPRHYRFQILNGSQARFLNLQLHLADAGDPTRPDPTRPGPAFVQIGTEGGFLPAPVLLNDPPRPFQGDGVKETDYNLMLAPAERADLVIDFSRFASSTLILWNDAPQPYPGGDPTDPDTRSFLQIEVGSLVGGADSPQLGLLEAIARDPAHNPNVLPPVVGFDPKAAVQVRNLTLNEGFDELGRLIQQLGTIDATATDYFGRPYDDAPTETPRAGTVEIWNIFNLTGDTHPIHFHLVNVQVLGRSAFDPATFQLIGPSRPPDENERGFKETVRMNPGECTTVIARFDLPDVPFPIPPSPRTGGHEYVWHCHILEHEEHDMMRPLVVKD